MSQVVFFPLPANEGTVSHAMNAWGSGRVRHFVGFIVKTIPWTAMQRQFDATPNANKNWSGTVMPNEATANITTSVSTVSMPTFLHPFCTASAASRSKRVSASSCEHGERRAQYDSAGEQRTPLPSVAYSSLLSAKGSRTTSSERKANNSVEVEHRCMV